MCSYDESRELEAEYPRDNLGSEEERWPPVFLVAMLPHRRMIIVYQQCPNE